MRHVALTAENECASRYQISRRRRRRRPFCVFPSPSPPHPPLPTFASVEPRPETTMKYLLPPYMKKPIIHGSHGHVRVL